MASNYPPGMTNGSMGSDTLYYCCARGHIYCVEMVGKLGGWFAATPEDEERLLACPECGVRMPDEAEPLTYPVNADAIRTHEANCPRCTERIAQEQALDAMLERQEAESGDE